VGTGKTVAQIVIEIDIQLAGGIRQGHEGVPGFAAFRGTRTKACIPFADTLSGQQLSWIVVEGQFGVFQHPQERLFLGKGFGDTLIEEVVA
jgi:hypothetical protein